MLRLVSFGVRVQVCVGGKQRERGGGDKPPVPADRIELPDSRVEALVAMGAPVFVWGG